MRVLSLIPPSKNEFDNIINGILNSAKYAHLRNNIFDFINRMKEKIKEFFFDLLKKFFSNIEEAAMASEGLSDIFMIIGFLLILLLVVFLIAKTSKGFERKRRIREILGEKIDSRTTPISLRDKASRYEREGDYRKAIRYDFIALLLLMHEKSIVYLDETKTNEEISNYLAKKSFPKLSIILEMIDTFNLSWYGHKDCDTSTYSVWNKNLNMVWGEVMNYEEKDK